MLCSLPKSHKSSDDPACQEAIFVQINFAGRMNFMSVVVVFVVVLDRGGIPAVRGIFLPPFLFPGLMLWESYTSEIVSNLRLLADILLPPPPYRSTVQQI